jgi:hypothetical protein
MKRIVIEKIFIYILCFLFCFVTSLNQGTISSNVEQEFLNDIASTMKTYNYVETECLTCDLKFIQEDNNIKIEYNANIDDVKIKTIDAEFNLNYTSNLNNIYSLLSKLYKENISTYSSEIQKMINDYTTTGKEQMWQDLNSNRQLTLRINKTTSIGKDYQLYYSITNLIK